MNTIFNYTFKDEALLQQALRHSSAKTTPFSSNERLEFLGDAVLGLVVSELLYKKFPDKEEGELTVIKSEVVSRPILTVLAKEYHIEQMIEIGKGIKQIPDSLLANALEAILGAIYLESGFDAASTIVKDVFSGKIDEISNRSYEINYKALLQHISQRDYATLPAYHVLKASGPAHKPVFEMTVKIAKETYGPATGKTKKEAEQNVAKIALEAIKSKNL